MTYSQAGTTISTSQHSVTFLFLYQIFTIILVQGNQVFGDQRVRAFWFHGLRWLFVSRKLRGRSEVTSVRLCESVQRGRVSFICGWRAKITFPRQRQPPHPTIDHRSGLLYILGFNVKPSNRHQSFSPFKTNGETYIGCLIFLFSGFGISFSFF